MVFRGNVSLKLEIRDILLADLALIVAFSLAISGGILIGTRSGSFLSMFEYVIPIAAVGVTLSFVLHELMHRFVARRYGAIAGFKTSLPGLMITLVTGAFGFLLGIPGATMIYTNRFSLKEYAIVSISGPLTNLAVFLAVFILTFALNPLPGTYLQFALSFIIYISVFLAFFNMLPIPPLDGYAVFKWNKPVYLGTMAVILVLLVFFTSVSIFSLIYVIIIALILSQFMRFVVR